MSLSSFFAQMTSEPFHKIWELMALPPERLLPALSLLAAFMVVCELTRIALGTELTHSVVAHVVVCLLTFGLQAIVLAVVLLHADHDHPGRGFLNLGFALGLYAVWYVTGQFTKLVRPVSEGADLGFMAVGAAITFPVGLVSALVFH
jgi:hypothetical protein